MYQIAIDGPSGAGKSSLAKAVAKKLGIIYVDTGALYRTVGYYVCSAHVDPKDADAVIGLLPKIQVDLDYVGDRQVVRLNGEDLGDRIRTPEISMYASAVSAIPAVRAFLLDTQRKIAATHSVIMDGRDIGTVILPNADVKIFLTANDRCRAERRCLELAEKGIHTTVEEVLADMQKRDEADRNREVAPAVAAPDATLFDNSYSDFETAAENLLRLITEKLSLAGKR